MTDDMRPHEVDREAPDVRSLLPLVQLLARIAARDTSAQEEKKRTARAPAFILWLLIVLGIGLVLLRLAAPVGG